MKRVLFVLALICLTKALYAQQPYIYTIKADSVKITNTCDTAELIIENHTQHVPGFLFNKGRGRTEFRKVLQKESDTFYMVGGDPLRIPNAWIQGGNRFGSTGILGALDNNHIDFYTNNTRQGRWTNTGNVLLGTTDDIGYKLNVNGKLRAGVNSLIGASDIASIANNTQSLTLYGNFQVVTGLTEGQNGGFSINHNAWGRPGATAMALNNVAVVAYDGRMYFGGPNAQYFSVNTSGHNGITGGPVSRTKYTLGNDSDPAGWNDSYASFGISSETEFRTISGYPSQTNYYYLETQLNSPVVSSNTGQVGVRAPLRIGARQLWFFTGDYKPGTEAARITEVGNVLIGSTIDNGNKLQVTGNTRLEGELGVTGNFLQGGGKKASFGNGLLFDTEHNYSRIFSGTEIIYQSNSTGDQHWFSNAIGTSFTGTFVTIDPGPYPGLPDEQLSLKVLGKYQTLGLAVNMAGRVGLGTLSPSAQLHTTGTVRFGGLTSNNSATRFLVCDVNGNLYYREDSGSAFNGAINSDLAVNGRVSAQKMLITQTSPWPDYVFSKQYQLPSLTEVENFIKQNNHLPGMPSAAEVEKKGIDVGDNQAALLKKIEELTLYTIQQDKELKILKQEMEELKALIKEKK